MESQSKTAETPVIPLWEPRVLSPWPDGSAPTYVNPTTEHIKTLIASQPDTIRVCFYGENIAVASGYGNTHISITGAVREAFKDRRWHPYELIIYRHHLGVIGTEGVSVNHMGRWLGCDPERASKKSAARWLTGNVKKIVLEIIEHWEANL